MSQNIASYTNYLFIYLFIYLLRTMVLYDNIYLALKHMPYILVQICINNFKFLNNRKSISFRRLRFLFHSPSLSQLALWTEPMAVKSKMVVSSLTICRYMLCFVVKLFSFFINNLACNLLRIVIKQTDGKNSSDDGSSKETESVDSATDTASKTEGYGLLLHYII